MNNSMRDVFGYSEQRVINKKRENMDEWSTQFISNSLLFMISSVDQSGRVIVSPRGGECGFVKVLDSKTLAYQEYSGNNLLETTSNILENPNVGLAFIIPGLNELLRIIGTAECVLP